MPHVFVARYWGLAVIGELTALTPAHVRLIDVKIDMGPVAGSAPGKESVKEGGKEPSPEKPRTLVIEGTVIGRKDDLDGELARYVMKLETSPLFQQISVQKSAVESFRKNSTLRFTIRVNIA